MSKSMMSKSIMPENIMQKNTTTIREPETKVVHTHRVSCDGGDGAGGHPKVFMDMGQADEAVCKYCGKKFVFKA